MNKFLTALLFVTLCCSRLFAASEYFAIKVVDDVTGRGVPLVELQTTNDIIYVTDSNGLIAFNEPGLMNQSVFFKVVSHGYEFPADAFGTRGAVLKTVAAEEATLKIKRLNIAERLYRITGQGIYRDTLLLNSKAPTSQPLLNGQVLGQDSNMTCEYRGQMFWFWGDTNKPSYPLGQFQMSGAVSAMPGKGGLDPSVGVDLQYFVDKNGFSRPMFPHPAEGCMWAGAFMTLPDATGRERMICHYSRVRGLEARLEQGLGMYNDEKEVFEPIQTIPLDNDIVPKGQPFRFTDNGVDYIYFASPYPNIRVKADLASWKDLASYEAFTCLKQGKKYDKAAPAFDRDAKGKLIYSWKRNTGLVGLAQQRDLEKAKLLKEGEGWWQCRDIETAKPVLLHGGPVNWNAYRKKWVMVFVEIFGSSLLGEIWYAEADHPQGPWPMARRIVTHKNYSFYNPNHHTFFDQDGGRTIYFEGTYTTGFTDNKAPTPRYEYNQIMYRLDLSDPRLKLMK
jgi:hypothetical protein